MKSMKGVMYIFSSPLNLVKEKQRANVKMGGKEEGKGEIKGREGGEAEKVELEVKRERQEN